MRHRPTSREVAGSIPDIVIGNFQLRIPFGRTMSWSTEPVTEYTRGFGWALHLAREDGQVELW